MKRALLSVSDKTNIVSLAKFLQEKNIEIISTGGTAKVLQENNITITPIQEVTGNPEAFGGRMKTISFEIGSALLFRRENKDDQADAKNLNITPIDFVICNLYPFQAISEQTQDLATRIENIDIGGPTMIRAAAKNYKSVTCLTSPEQYEFFQNNFESLDEEYRFKMAMEAFEMTAEYDQFIVNTLHKKTLPIASTQKKELRYGENPHQKAWLVPWKNTDQDRCLAQAKQWQGKELSYNNMIDADAAWKTTSDLNQIFPSQSIVTIVKHANPCGVCSASDQVSAIKKAWECDPISSFGSIISFNQKVELQTAQFLLNRFIEIIIAPSFSHEAKDLLKQKKNLRLLEVPNKPSESHEYVIKSINGALLIQEEDEQNGYEFITVTDKKLPEKFDQLKKFGMIVNKYLKSNSILLAGLSKKDMVIAGAGMGQPNRLDSLKMLAGPRAKALNFAMNEVLLISDAFFPFADSIECAHELGIKFLIQPGGSVKDQEVIKACNQFEIAMEFTNTRHFRH
ncbi:MAG: bifunctional phosphoribosylaminoimidazolecarboxamide formyltransferase/IMP cyclohydrolase PurH [Halobacteriovoraceae bacterium]|nr:bifunctional phosphoribosylaminoimidazolecarboxamide formyltransferase/IMP cyclohydrolase PurH [Halobacteriovoraceae bacterium]